jgi:hypothetical protein
MSGADTRSLVPAQGGLRSLEEGALARFVQISSSFTFCAAKQSAGVPSCELGIWAAVRASRVGGPLSVRMTVQAYLRLITRTGARRGRLFTAFARRPDENICRRLVRLRAASARDDSKAIVGLAWSGGGMPPLCLAHEDGTATDFIAADSIGTMHIACAAAMVRKIVESTGAPRVRLLRRRVRSRDSHRCQRCDGGRSPGSLGHRRPATDIALAMGERQAKMSEAGATAHQARAHARSKSGHSISMR